MMEFCQNILVIEYSTRIFWQNSIINFCRYLNIFIVFLSKIPLHFGLKFSFFNFNSCWIPSKFVLKGSKIGLNFTRILDYVLVELGENYAWILFEIQSELYQKRVHFNSIRIRSRSRKYTWIFWENSFINFWLNVKWIFL